MWTYLNYRGALTNPVQHNNNAYGRLVPTKCSMATYLPGSVEVKAFRRGIAVMGTYLTLYARERYNLNTGYFCAVHCLGIF